MNPSNSQPETLADDETKVVGTNAPRIDALKELADFELAYVGGGTAVVMFQ